MVPEQPTLLTVREVAELLGLHPESVRKMVRVGRLPGFKAGRSWRFDRAEIMTWLRNRSEKAIPKASVLVVDDEQKVRMVLEHMLGRLGCRSVATADGRAGLAQVADERPDIILLDLRMPGMNGVEFLRALRETEPDLPVVLVTGYPDSVLVREAMEHPPILLLPKPVEIEGLNRTLRAVFEAPLRALEPATSEAEGPE